MPILATAGLIAAGFLAAKDAFRTPEIHEPKTMTIHVLRWAGPQPIIRIEAHCYNQNALGFTYKGGQLDLFLDTFYLGHAVVDTSFEVAAHSPFTVPIQMQLDVIRLGAHGMNLAHDVRIKVKGTMQGSAFGISRSLPIAYEGTQLIHMIMNYPVNGQ